MASIKISNCTPHTSYADCTYVQVLSFSERCEWRFRSVALRYRFNWHCVYPLSQRHIPEWRNSFTRLCNKSPYNSLYCFRANFYILSTVHFGTMIVFFNKLMHRFFILIHLLHSLHVSSTIMLIFRRSNCISTASVFVTLETSEWSVVSRVIPDAVLTQFDLLKMSIIMLETCRLIYWMY